MASLQFTSFTVTIIDASYQLRPTLEEKQNINRSRRLEICILLDNPSARQRLAIARLWSLVVKRIGETIATCVVKSVLYCRFLLNIICFSSMGKAYFFLFQDELNEAQADQESRKVW